MAHKSKETNLDKILTPDRVWIPVMNAKQL